MTTSHAAEDLLRSVARAFHGDEALVVLDLLIRNSYQTPEEEIGRRLQLSSVVVRRALAELHGARLIVPEARAPIYEPRPQDEQLQQLLPFKRERVPRPKSFWYIDYPRATNAIRYRLHALLTAGGAAVCGGAATGAPAAASDVAFVCPRQGCEKAYTLVEATAGADPMRGTFRCLRCRTELVAPTEAQLERQRKAAADAPEAIRRREEIAAALRPLAELLKQALSRPMPEFRKLTPTEERILAEIAEAKAEAAGHAGGHHGPGGAAGPASMVVDVVAAAPAGAMPSADSAAAGKAKPKAAVPWLSQAPQATEAAEAPSLPTQHQAVKGKDISAKVLITIPEIQQQEPPAASTTEESTMISVGGRQIAFEQVTEEDKAKMTDAELQAYSALLLERIGGF